MALPDQRFALETYDYPLPKDRIAEEPRARREDARLLCADPWPRLSCADRSVMDLPALLRPEDLLVVNATRVVPARLFGHREKTGGRAELLWLSQTEIGAQVLLKTRGSPEVGESFEFACGQIRATVARVLEGGQYEVRTEPADSGAFLAALETHGQMPLPPYIPREADDPRSAGLDKSRYQTVFAQDPGAIAAPTAGLHLGPDLLAALEAAGIQRATITLHVGLGTFKPVQVLDVRDHVMHEEAYSIPAETISAIAATQRRRGRVVAVGTTVVRALEAAALRPDGLRAGPGATALMIAPGFRFQVVDALMTNFHAPKSTLLLLLAAFLGEENWRPAYDHALASGYRFLSYGDAMFIPRRQTARIEA